MQIDELKPKLPDPAKAAMTRDVRALQIQRDGLSATCDRLKARVTALEADVAELRVHRGLRRVLHDVRRMLAPDSRRQSAPLPREPAKRRGDRRTRPSIAIVTDTLDWSFANIAYKIDALLSDDFEISIISTVELGDDAVLALYLARDHDLIHFLWRESVFEARVYFPQSVALYFETLDAMNALVSHKTTFTVYDHLFIGDADIGARSAMFNEHAISYAVCSERLKGIYENIAGFPRPAMTLRDGVDRRLFRPLDLDRFDDVAQRPLRVGWVGNSNWANDLLEDSKGFRTILLPGLERVAEAGCRVEGIYADKNSSSIPHEYMPTYYARIDVLVCTSAIEGTPNPLLEAMACGVPVVTTNVGIAPEVFGPLQKAFILADRSADCLSDALRRLIADPTLIRSLSAENLAQVAEWDWEVRIEAFRSFFWDALAKNGSARKFGRK